MDDSMSTPISQLQQEPVFPPPPQMQSMNQQYQYMQQQPQHVQQNSQPAPVDNVMDDKQKELMFLFIIILVVSSEPVQRQLMTSLPSLFNDSKSSIVASGINAAAICALFYTLRHVKIQI